jgi:hypothetical protein
MNITLLRTLLLAAFVLLGAGGCRSYLSYVPLEPQSPGWSQAKDGEPGDVVWSADGVTVRAWAAEPFGAGMGGTGNSDYTPRVIEMDVVVTNDGPGLLVVGAAIGDLDPGTRVEEIDVLSGRSAFVALGYDDLSKVEWSAGMPLWSHEGEVREVAFRVRVTAQGFATPDRALPIEMRILRGDSEMACPANFRAVGCARESQWYTVPLDGVVYTGQALAVVASVPFAVLGLGPIYSP